MITMFLFVIVLAANLFSPENLVTVIVGTIVTYFGTNLIKGKSVQGPVALAIAVVLSLVVAVIALVVSGIAGGDGFSFTGLAHQGSQIFALATIAYKLFEA